MNYEEIFRERGGAYHEAMKRWPEARRDDFVVPLAWVAPAAGETLVDVPSGGGYLGRYVPASCRWFPHEPCASFAEGVTSLDAQLLPLPFADGFADCAISIAGVHHLDDKRPLFREFRRVLKPLGRVLIADVHEDSGVARFLDDFVGPQTVTGHEGRYLGPATLADLEATGFSVRRAERVTYPWRFADESELGAFCRLLFGMQDIEADAVVRAAGRYLGIRTEDGRIALNWELYFVLAEPVSGDA